MRQQQQIQPFQDLMPGSAIVPCRLGLGIIADIGKESTILEVLVRMCYRRVDTPHARQREQLCSSHRNLVTIPSFDGSVRWKEGLCVGGGDFSFFPL